MYQYFYDKPGYFPDIPGVPKKCPPKSKKISVFFKTYCQGMKVIVFGKCNKPRGARPVELINLTKYIPILLQRLTASRLAVSL